MVMHREKEYGFIYLYSKQEGKRNDLAFEQQIHSNVSIGIS